MNIYFLFGIFFSCSSSKTLDTGSLEDTLPFEIETPTELVLIPERPQDISISQDGEIFISSQTGDFLYQLQKTLVEIQELYEQQSIDPQDIREEMTGDFNNILAVEHVENDIYFTTTDFGVEGSLSWISSSNGIAYQTETLHTSSIDGTLIRHPVELKKPPSDTTIFSQDLWIADYEAKALFSYNNNQISVHSAGQTHPESLAFGNLSNQEVLFIGGEEGIWYKENADAIPTLLSDIPALSLMYLSEHEELWIGNNEGIFVLELSKTTSPINLKDAHQIPNISSRIARLIHKNNLLFYTDGIGEYVYITKIIRNDET